jgi:6-phosphogluconolactonase
MGSSSTGAEHSANSLLLAVLLVLLGLHAVPKAVRAQAPVGRAAAPEAFWVFVGTYTSGDAQNQSEGIYALEFNVSSGMLSSSHLAAAVADPSFLAIHPNGRFLYSVNEQNHSLGGPGGGVSAFSLDSERAVLAFLNRQSSGGDDPCHLTVDRAGKNLVVANYGSGSVACLPIEADGRLQLASTALQHRGRSEDKKRQQGPHAHSINLDAAGRFAVAADLGLDQLLVYRFDSSEGKLTPNEPPFTKVAPGSGPRHFAFHPSGRFGYVINEMANTVVAFAYDSATGTLSEIQTISTLPQNFKGRSHTAEVQVHPSGKFLYGSNRGHDSIAIFSIDQGTGKLSTLSFEPTQGKSPRNFALDPSGSYLLAENQGTNTIVVFRIDPQTGALQPTGQTVHVPKPVCIKMIPKPGGTAK